MISVHDALSRISEGLAPLSPVSVALFEGAGLTLAEDVRANVSIPPFRQSSMDGYAIRFEDRARTLRVAGESAAGKSSQRILHPGEAERIFTGAPLPAGADTVVMQERAVRDGDSIRVDDADLVAGRFVRPIGAEILEGEVALRTGAQLTPGAIGYLAGIGCAQVRVYPRPRVAVLVTGDELRTPGEPLGDSEIYESNSYALRAALKFAGYDHVPVTRAKDDPTEIERKLATALETHDVVLVTGGVSVGDHDHVVRAAETVGVRTGFHRVRQKPGKPLYFGRKGAKIVFGLPGNPASVLTCFYVYVRPALDQIAGRGAASESRRRLKSRVEKPPGLTHFLKAVASESHVGALSAQESHRMSSFATANALLVLPEGRDAFEPEEEVEILLLN